MDVGRELVIHKVWDSPDVVPEVLDALRALTDEEWAGAATIEELCDSVGDRIVGTGCDLDEFCQTVRRHVGQTWGGSG